MKRKQKRKGEIGKRKKEAIEKGKERDKWRKKEKEKK